MAVIAAGISFGGVAGAGDVSEGDVDVGHMPESAKEISSAADVIKIKGYLDPNDIDLFHVCVGEKGLTASTLEGNSLDTELYVFRDGRSSGDGVTGVASSDDAASGVTQSNIVLNGNDGSIKVPAGEYFIGISGYNSNPRNRMDLSLFPERGLGQRMANELATPWLDNWAVRSRVEGAYVITVEGTVSCAAEPAPLDVAIDVKPGSDKNPIKASAGGRTPLAVVSTDTFDATSIDAATIVAGPGAAPAVHTAEEDVDEDGITDLVVHVETRALGLTSDDTQLCVDATTADGQAVRGCDAVWVK